jgi:hypothetical protein
MSSSHYIRTVRTPYTGRPSSSFSLASTSSSENYAVENIQTNKYPPGLGFTAWRTSLASLSPVNIQQFAGGSGSKRPQRPAIRIPYTSRRPLPAPSQRGSVEVRDPYASLTPSVSYDSPQLIPRTYGTSETYPSDVPRLSRLVQPITLEPPPLDRNARSKLVAGILLHRVHAVGKPMRRRPGDAYPRSYIRSGLSTMVSVEA